MAIRLSDYQYLIDRHELLYYTHPSKKERLYQFIIMLLYVVADIPCTESLFRLDQPIPSICPGDPVIDRHLLKRSETIY